MVYFIHILILVTIYSIATIGLDIITRRTGILSLGHAAFYSLGAYSYAILSLKTDVPFVFIIVISLLIPTVLGGALAFPSLRVSGDYLAMTTLGFGEITYVVLREWHTLTGGTIGLRGIPSLPFLPSRTVAAPFLMVSLSALGLAVLIAWRVIHSPFGKTLNAIRDHEIVVMMLGKNPLKYKVHAFLIGSALAGLAGILYAAYTSYIDPTLGGISESILMLCMMLMGGLFAHTRIGTLGGNIVAVGLLIAIPEGLRFIGLPGYVAGTVRQILYGTALIILMYPHLSRRWSLR
jgi:branched-chain amino acid transport system permease protein